MERKIFWVLLKDKWAEQVGWTRTKSWKET